jgi:hypothetical protein
LAALDFVEKMFEEGFHRLSSLAVMPPA